MLNDTILDSILGRISSIPPDYTSWEDKDIREIRHLGAECIMLFPELVKELREWKKAGATFRGHKLVWQEGEKK